MANGSSASVKQPRKSSFLLTLSRLGNKDKHNQAVSPSLFDSSFPPSPSSFTSAQKPEGDVGALPAYLTTLANHPTFKSARAWKRFVHVRTDDLQSQRVERMIKRVRSDVAGHTSTTATTGTSSTIWKDSRRSAALSITSAIPSPLGAAPMSTSIHGVDDDVHPKTPSSRPGTAASSIRKESTIGEVEDEREDDADAEGEDEGPTTPVLARSQPQSLTSAAASVNGPATLASHIEERPETPVQRSVRDARAVESESVSSAIDTSEFTASTLPTSLETESDTDIAAAAVAVAATKTKMVGITPTPTFVSAPSATGATDLGHSSSMKRSASANPRKRVASDDSITTASKHQHQHRTHLKHHYKHRAETERALDTEAEAAFDTDIEHPSSATPPDGVANDSNGAVTDFEMIKGSTISGMISSLKQRKKKSSKKISINDFDMMRVLGKGCAGKVRNMLIVALEQQH